MTALAKRAVACKGWRWMAGMLDLAEHGECRVVRVATDDSHTGQFLDYTWPDEEGLADLVVSSEYGPHGNFLPDLDDPATLGCFEHELLPEAGYHDAHLTAWRDDDGRTMWGVLYRPDPVNIPGTWLSAVETGSPTKAEALVAALESAP